MNLTKSLFKEFKKCPRRLNYYLHNEEQKTIDDLWVKKGYEFENTVKKDFQGIDLSHLSIDDNYKKTTELLKKKNIIIFEAVVKYKDLLVRVDILEKKGNDIYCYEIKLKTLPYFDEIKASSKYKDFMHDITFQSYVLLKAFGNVHSYFISPENNKYKLIKADIKEEHYTNLEKDINIALNILNNKEKGFKNISSNCKKCPFEKSLKKCLEEQFGQQLDFSRENIFDLYYNKDIKSQVNDKIFYLKNLNYGEITSPLDRKSRQSLQIKLADSDEEYIDKSILKDFFTTIKAPYHFIDFETAIHDGDTKAFQFSHHVINDNGNVIHKNQFLSFSKNPNAKFLKELYSNLKNNDGTIFIWSNHEKSIIKSITENQEILKCFEERCIDMLQFYKSMHYLAETKGQNSIKNVSEAILSKFTLKDVHSLNSSTINLTKGIYQSLDINNGMLASNAYLNNMVLSKILKRSKVRKSLLKYCEIDTLCMVLIFKYWKSLFNN